MPTKTYHVPPRFFWDHTARDLPEQGVSRVVKDTKTSVAVELDTDAYADLLSDAEYYSDTVVAYQMGEPGLASSARATVRALVKQGAPS
jgi:hypothetical protein